MLHFSVGFRSCLCCRASCIVGPKSVNGGLQTKECEGSLDALTKQRHFFASPPAICYMVKPAEGCRCCVTNVASVLDNGVKDSERI